MLLKLFAFVMFFALLSGIKSKNDEKDRRNNHEKSRSSVAYFNAKIQQIEISHLINDKNGKSDQRQTQRKSKTGEVYDNLLESHNDENIGSRWTEWSFCSQPCGGGVSMRSRICAEARLHLDSSNSCEDGGVQYKTCNAEQCPGQELDSRSCQCSEYNYRAVFPTARFNWTPYYGSNVEPCHLTCKASGFDLYKTFGLVRDGTPCWDDKTDVCIDGKCLKVGCDQIVGSNLTHDACGTCGGDSTGCYHFASNYSQAPSDAGNVRFNYYEIAMVPTGATHIKIQESSENVLALMEAEGKFVKYVMNGNWMMQSSGPFTAAGTDFQYTTNRHFEVLEGVGPTTMDLHIMMIYLDDRPLVHYEYWIPTKQIEIAFHENFDMNSEDPTFQSKMEPETNPNELPHHNELNELVGVSRVMKVSNASTTISLPRSTSPSANYAKHETNTTEVRHHRRKAKKRQKSSYCQTCKKPRNRRKYFCKSDFVVRALIVSKTRMRGKCYRHDLKILAVYKSEFPLMKREFLWVYKGCCPKLRPGRKYLLMGQKEKILRLEKSKKDNCAVPQLKEVIDYNEDLRLETRLFLSRTDFWHPWRRKYSAGLNRLSRKMKCKDKKHITKKIQ